MLTLRWKYEIRLRIPLVTVLITILFWASIPYMRQQCSWGAGKAVNHLVWSRYMCLVSSIDVDQETIAIWRIYFEKREKHPWRIDTFSKVD